ncbi:hypothetical protein FRC01_008155 [Tulasnella sp. 417]|nr:hypothetical protein FRC01_008155 [Tulasnella sp. 417]
MEHSTELATLREGSQAVADQLRSAHKVEIESINAAHQEALDSQVKALEKQISNLKLELGATQDGLSKSKAAVATNTSEIDALKAQVEQAKKDGQAEKDAAIKERESAMEDLAKQLANTQKEMSDLDTAFKSTQTGYAEEIAQMKQNHDRELEEASVRKVQALDDAQRQHDEALATLKVEIAELKSELDDEREAKSRAVAEANTLRTKSPPATPQPKAQPNGAGSPEKIAQLHQAHEAKLAEMESDFRKQIKLLTEEKAELAKANTGLEAQVAREKMEKEMFEEQANDAEAEITALKAELDQLQK